MSSFKIKDIIYDENYNMSNSSIKSKGPFFNKTYEDFIYIMQENYPEDFDKLDWKSISSFRFLSSQFIEDFAEYISWTVICTHQKLSETLIRKFISKIDFKIISITQLQNLSIDFMIEYYKKLDIKLIKNRLKKLLRTDLHELNNNISYYYQNNKYIKTSICDDNIITLNKYSIPTNKKMTQECVF
jgi:hypothetical protein